VLYAELRSNAVALGWSPSKSEEFTSYVVVRSTTDQNPYYPKTQAVATFSDKTDTSFTDRAVEKGKDYYYRICQTKTGKRAACGNILHVTF